MTPFRYSSSFLYPSVSHMGVGGGQVRVGSVGPQSFAMEKRKHRIGSSINAKTYKVILARKLSNGADERKTHHNPRPIAP